MLDITTLAAWGEFLGGIAVVVSLIYLASQIRQNSRLLRVSTAGVTIDTQTRLAKLLAGDSEAAQVFIWGIADRDALSEVDRQRFDAMIFLYIDGMDQEYRLAQDGVMGPKPWEARKRRFRGVSRQPGLLNWWTQFRDLYDSGFRECVDGLIREGEAAE